MDVTEWLPMTAGQPRATVKQMSSSSDSDGYSPLRPPALSRNLVNQRQHGTLDHIRDSERRALRSIGTPAREVAVSTGALLTGLVALPNVRIFHGIRPAVADLPVIPLALVAGRLVLLIEAVAWPPGRYETAPAGNVHCDGTYIGQSVGPLLASVGHWRRALPTDHKVCAVVVVHPGSGGQLTLPANRPGEIVWLFAADVAWSLGGTVRAQRLPVRRAALRSLIAATEPDYFMSQ